MHDLTQPPSAWLEHYAWPLWLERGVDWKAGAFHEWLDSGTLACDAGYRRLRVVTRQIYVFSRAAERKVGRAVDAVALGLDFLRRHARQGNGGYAWRFGLDNKPIDFTRDLYDHAFVLLALASAYGTLKDESIREEAMSLVHYLDGNLRHPVLGYRESIPDSAPRRQNPHMHLTEAMIAAHRAFGDLVYFERATELIDLFLTRLFQPADWALPEYFDDYLVPLREDSGRFLVEPGHHFEWQWLLDDYLRLAKENGKRVDDAEIESTIEKLAGYAVKYGIDPETGLVWDVTDCLGDVRERAFRLWPQCEWLKAAAIRPQLSEVGVRECRLALAKFTSGMPAGLWRERIPSESTAAPATSLYHLTCALMHPAVDSAKPLRLA